jgi:tetratricopeptide (TPR) repeat protein
MHARLAWLLAAAIWTASAAAPVIAEDGARLDGLYADLKSSTSQSEAEAVQRKIWLEWLRSGDPVVDEMMQAALVGIQAGRLSQALVVLDQVVREAPEYAEGWNSRATVLYLLGALDRSVADIGRTLSLDPRHFGAMAGLGKILTQQGRFAEALAIYRQALAVNPFMVEREEVIPMLERKVRDKKI